MQGQDDTLKRGCARTYSDVLSPGSKPTKEDGPLGGQRSHAYRGTPDILASLSTCCWQSERHRVASQQCLAAAGHTSSHQPPSNCCWQRAGHTGQHRSRGSICGRVAQEEEVPAHYTASPSGGAAGDNNGSMRSNAELAWEQGTRSTWPCRLPGMPHLLLPGRRLGNTRRHRYAAPASTREETVLKQFRVFAAIGALRVPLDMQGAEPRKGHACANTPPTRLQCCLLAAAAASHAIRPACLKRPEPRDGALAARRTSGRACTSQLYKRSSRRPLTGACCRAAPGAARWPLPWQAGQQRCPTCPACPRRPSCLEGRRHEG